MAILLERGLILYEDLGLGAVPLYTYNGVNNTITSPATALTVLSIHDSFIRNDATKAWRRSVMDLIPTSGSPSSFRQLTQKWKNFPAEINRIEFLQRLFDLTGASIVVWNWTYDAASGLVTYNARSGFTVPWSSFIHWVTAADNFFAEVRNF